jgi:hypothetical protein
VVGFCKSDNEHLGSNTRQGISDEQLCIAFCSMESVFDTGYDDKVKCLIFPIHSKTEHIR